MPLKLNVLKPRSYIRILKLLIVISVIVTVTFSFFNVLKRRAEDKQKALDDYAQKLQLEKIKLQEARDNPISLSNEDVVSEKTIVNLRCLFVIFSYQVNLLNLILVLLHYVFLGQFFLNGALLNQALQ